MGIGLALGDTLDIGVSRVLIAESGAGKASSTAGATPFISGMLVALEGGASLVIVDCGGGSFYSFVVSPSCVVTRNGIPCALGTLDITDSITVTPSITGPAIVITCTTH
jgi:hypothetical protein